MVRGIPRHYIALPKRPEPTMKVPVDAPCNDSCLQRVGSSICKNKCPYWPTLKKLADEGKLEKVK